MNKLQKLFLSIGLLAIAGIVHCYYVSYKPAVRGHLIAIVQVTGPAADRIHKALEVEAMRSEWAGYSANEVALRLDVDTDADLINIIEKGGPLPPRDVFDFSSEPWTRDRAVQNLTSDIERKRNSLATEYTQVKQFEAATVARIDSQPVYLGMFPSENIGGSKLSRRQTALWAGIVFPLILLLAAGLLMLSVVSKKERQQISIIGKKPLSIVPEQLGYEDTTPVQAFSDGGHGKRDDPFVIKDIRDYVSAEYEIASFVMQAEGQEFELVEQGVGTVDGRTIDQLLFDVKPAGTAEWKERRRFFFDITAPYKSNFNQQHT